MSIRNIVFDFGGVLIDWNPEYLYQNIFPDKAEMDFFLKNVCNSSWNLTLDAGKAFSVAIRERIHQYPDYENEINLYYSHWLKMIGGAIVENTVLIQHLKHNFRLFGLTNWSAETFPLVYDKYSFFSDLEGIVVSGQEKVVKPDLSIYKLLLHRYKIKATESLFIDDSIENIKAARQLGFNTVHIHSEMNLKAELLKIGIRRDKKRIVKIVK